MSEPDDAFATLMTLSRRFDEQAKGLSAQGEVVHTRSVVCFSLLGVNLVVALEEISELLKLPSITQLPRVKPWVKGVANVRGRLLPVVNFAEFLGGSSKTSPKQQRVLVLDMIDVFVGLIVDQVYSMRHFRLDSYRQEISEAPEVLMPYLEGGFEYEGETWLLFRPSVLVQDYNFMDVAV